MHVCAFQVAFCPFPISFLAILSRMLGYCRYQQSKQTIHHSTHNFREQMSFSQFLHFFSSSRRPPLDSTTFIGFYISLLFNFVIITSYYKLYVTVCVLHIGFCSYLNACVEDLSLLTQSIDQQLTENTEFIRIRAAFINIVEIHVKVTK